LKKIIFFIAFCCLTYTSISATNLVNNGSFEDGRPGSNYLTFLPIDTDLDGWTIEGANVDVVIFPFWNASDKLRSVDLNGTDWSIGTAAGGVSQVIKTVPGLTYEVTFDLSGNAWDDGVSPATKLMTVGVDAAGSTPQQYDYTVPVLNSTNMSYDSNTYYFVATGENTKLTFRSDILGMAGPVIDNVTMAGITAQICHRDFGKRTQKTLIVGLSAIPAHLAHGDVDGPCVGGSKF
jgi:choice-of-anchor C domain-containing protein